MSVVPGTRMRASGRASGSGRDAVVIPFPVRPPVRQVRPAPIRLTRRGRVVVALAVVLLMVGVATVSVTVAGG